MTADQLPDDPDALKAMDQLVASKGKRLLIALIPVGTVDPDYVEFWRPWPKYFSHSLTADARHRRLAVALRQAGVPFIDLRDELDVPDRPRAQSARARARCEDLEGKHRLGAMVHGIQIGRAHV